MRSIKSILQAIDNRVEISRHERKDIYVIPNTYEYQQVVVFESDDWGSIRMSKRQDWDEMLRMGYAVDKRPYERYDTLESPTDMEALFDVLSKHTDTHGHHPVITINMLMANPDFEKIRQSGYKQYYYEPITETYTHYFGDARVIDMLREGMDDGLLMPQCHGREHFNVAQWLKGLQKGDGDLLTAFQHGICGIAPKGHPEKGNQLMNALRAENNREQEEIDNILAEGLQMFEQMWGFKSKSFVAPCYCWAESAEEVMAKEGVELIQTARASKSAYRSPSRYFYAGQKNKYGQVYSIRNCHFEPSTHPGGESAEGLMKQVDRLFHQRKIAVFSTHRINYVGGIHEENRTNNLKLLDEFLTKLLEKYPNVAFLSSNQLTDIYKHQ